ncbi:MAG: DUF4139 domain-containing protein [Calditrichaeota bacterium]|nr:MAG: DUF4139 domain-containing protein [Calditrichota bacterium]MBL1205979.1 DUF4139 domain-containing protein [Calditrichota bacterium]NOG45807.1 DUF4139 domain-containing protein [Calditrichota bacterium]
MKNMLNSRLKNKEERKSRSIISTVFFSGLILLSGSFSFAQQSTSITITNNNLGLVKEERVLDLTKGRQKTNLEDIPALINPASVLIESDFSVLEQNFEYDLISVDKILQKSLEKEIVIDHPEQGKMEGVLLSATGSNMILKTIDGMMQIIPRNNKQKISLKGLASEKQPFIIRPTLVWDINSEKKGSYNTKVSYLTKGLTWNADYVALLNEDDSKITLSGWVTINNTSGKTFRDTKLKLMAGDLNLVQSNRGRGTIALSRAFAKSEDSFSEKSFFEYHLYDLNRKTDLQNNQIKQIQLFGETAAKVKKIYRITSYNPSKTAVIISLNNSKKNNLGMPLPQGVIRLYKKDADEREFVGENRIEHTPKDEKIDIETGKAFDIVSERTVRKSTKITNRSERRKVEYKIRNHKEEKVSLEIVENFQRRSEVNIHSANGTLIEQKDGSIKYQIDAPADKETIFILEFTLSW